MKKKLLAILFPVMLTLACTVAVWGTEEVAQQPACDKCAKVAKPAGCGNCAKMEKAAQGCEKCAKAQTDAAAAPCGGCNQAAKMQQVDVKPCCNRAGLQ